jgi:magnesium transporter
MFRARQFSSGQPPTDVDVGQWPDLRRHLADEESVTTLWVDVTAPTETDLARLQELIGLDPRAAELLLRPDRRPSVRVYEHHYVVTVLDLDVDETPPAPHTTVTELDLVVGPSFLLSIHRRPLQFAQDLEERVSANPRLGSFDATYLLHIFVDALLGHYARELDGVEDAVSQLEKRLLRDATRRGLDHMLLLKDHTQTVRRLMASHRDALGMLVGTDSPIADEKVQRNFRDSLERLDALEEHLDRLRETVTGSYNLYISNVSHRTNQQLRVLTFLSAILLPMAVIAALYGTNFKLVEYESVQAFYVMLAGMGVIAAGMLTFFRVKGWL